MDADSMITDAKSLEECEELRAKLRKQYDLPAKGVRVGKGPWAPIPDEYAPGANGWTDEVCELIQEDKGYCLSVDSEIAALNGKRLKDGTTLDLGTLKEQAAQDDAKSDLSSVETQRSTP